MSIPLSPPIILIVDDNFNNLDVLSETLLGSGLQVAIAIDGESAIEQASYCKPDLILLDVMMPGLDGFATCKILKGNAATCDIPIIFMTALSDVESKVKGLSMGAVDYITKPFQYEEVMARVRVHLELRFLTRQVLEQSLELQRINQELLKLNQELKRLANLDGLTGIANRRRFEEYLEQQWQQLIAKESQFKFSLILCDIDYFKHYNDYYGHQMGDDCLRKVAQAISSSLNHPTYLAARYGGEEFAIVLPDTSPDEAQHVAARIGLTVKQLQIEHDQSQVSSCVTLSMGISSQTSKHISHPQTLLTMADKALYLAKTHGRDTFCYLPVEAEK